MVFLIIVILILIVFKIVRTFIAPPASQSTTVSQEGGNKDRGGGGLSGNKSGDKGGGKERGGGQNKSGGQGKGSGQGGGGGQGGGKGGGERNATAVRVRPVTLGTIENSVILNGDVLSSSQVSIFPLMAGKLTELRIHIGDRVRAGQVIAMVDPSRPGDPFFPNPVTSTVSGVVVFIPVNTGDTLQTNSAICVIGNLADLQVETFVPERYSVSVYKGLSAQLSFEAMPGEFFPAVIDELSPVLDPASRTLRILLRLVPDKNGKVDSRIIAGMFATISLVTNSRSNVPVIPRNSLIQTYGTWIVFVVPSGSSAVRRREVTLGLESETTVEILTGLKAGEQVVSEGQNFLTDGDEVKIVE